MDMPQLRGNRLQQQQMHSNTVAQYPELEQTQIREHQHNIKNNHTDGQKQK